MYDLDDMLIALESVSNSISDNLNTVDLHLVIFIQTILMFQAIKQKTYDEILKLIENANTFDSQTVIFNQKLENQIEKFNLLAVDSLANWSQTVWNMYEYINAANKHEKSFGRSELQNKIDNLKEIAVFLSSDALDDNNIDGKDPLEYLKCTADLYNSTHKPKETPKPPETPRKKPMPTTNAGGCCGESCLIL
jgi:hypothetical protein